MFLKNLYLKDFRIFSERLFSFSQRCNIFYGDNGVGKTTILESIGYLGRGKSFRTSFSKKLIQHGKNSFILTGELEKNNLKNHIGIEVKPSENRRLQLNGQSIKTHNQLTELMPLIWVNQFNSHLFLETPLFRRQFLNWGVFHFANEFFNIWKKFIKALKQRNIALKKRLCDQQVLCWDDELVKHANVIDQMRKDYIDALKPFVLTCMNQFMDKVNIDLRYERGWPDDVNLLELLEKTFESDQRLRHTQFGPHRMDIKIFIGGDDLNAKDFCSQGQHKMLSYVFHLAQGQLFESKHGYSPLFLIDDLPSEFDEGRLSSIGLILNELNSQVFISGVSKESFVCLSQACDAELFHVKQKLNS